MNVRQVLFLFGTCLLGSFSSVSANESFSSGNAYLLPLQVKDVARPILSLNGTWKLKYPKESRWMNVCVPGELAMQGIAIEHDKPFIYRKTFEFPEDYDGHRIILRFDGVYSHAKLSVNGHYIREHCGGFTRWETDVTSWLHYRKKNEIQLEVTDPLDDISYASGYAHHPVGGILRDVTLFALPNPHIYDVNIETDLDSLYKDAHLDFSCSFTGKDSDVELVLRIPEERGNQLFRKRFALKEGKNSFTIPVKSPLKWDAEHPHLYGLEVSLVQAGKELCRFHRQIGFRKIEIKGNRMLVNGRPVKLRGACRHDIHPTLGRTTTAELDSLDAILFKQANMNFVRTSHYPPSEHFLKYCDRYGIYVECETAVCFVDTYRQKNYAPGKSQNSPEFTQRYLSQCAEMVKTFQSHASVLLWSIGNESKYGSNFQKCWEWIKKTDKTRPVIFSWPGTVKGTDKIYDILSMHYQDVYGERSQFGITVRGFQKENIPVLFDEWAHPACYTYNTLQVDPNIREFWGKSLDMMWSGLFDATGGLGGAIWGYVDETFALPEPKVGVSFWKEFARTAKPKDFQGNCVGYGEWGIVDVWRRQKPEFWSTKKAYSPIRLLAENNLEFTAGQRLILPVYNRFDHTNLKEISASYIYNGKKKTVVMPDIGPHLKGTLVFSAEDWKNGEALLVEFHSADGMLIDAYRYVLGTDPIDYPLILNGKNLSVQDHDGFVTVRGDGFEVPFDKETGLITGAKAGDSVLIEKGPFLNLYINYNHLTGTEVRKQARHFATITADWKKTNFCYKQQGNSVYIDLSGIYKEVNVDFKIKIAPSGQLDINYLVSDVPNGFLREAGVAFLLSNAMQQLKWKRKGYWNYYPEGSFAGNEGSTSLYLSRQAAYGARPVQPWQADTHNYYYWADTGANCRTPLTQMAKGMKENIYYYTLSYSSCSKHQLTIVSPDASVACRIYKNSDERLMLYVNNRWDYPEIAWGNYCKKQEAVPCYGHVGMSLF